MAASAATSYFPISPGRFPMVAGVALDVKGRHVVQLYILACQR